MRSACPILGMRILYDVMNRMPQVWCERVFAPWGDMEEQMRQTNLPLWALESGDAVRDFDGHRLLRRL